MFNLRDDAKYIKMRTDFSHKTYLSEVKMKHLVLENERENLFVFCFLLKIFYFASTLFCKSFFLSLVCLQSHRWQVIDKSKFDNQNHSFTIFDHSGYCCLKEKKVTTIFRFVLCITKMKFHSVCICLFLSLFLISFLMICTILFWFFFSHTIDFLSFIFNLMDNLWGIRNDWGFILNDNSV